MIRKLRIRFIAITMVIVALMLGIIFGTLYGITRTGLERESIAMMERLAQDTFQPRQPNLPSGELQLPFFVLELSTQGTLLKAFGGFYDLSDEAFLEDVVRQVLSSGEATGMLREYDLRYYRITSPWGQRLVFADMSSEHATLARLLRTCVIIGGLSLLVFLGISILLARWAVRPVDQAWKQQKQFVADASHELKTPLTVITTNAELLRSVQDLSEVAGFSDNILHMSRHMRTLVEQMLELARADRKDSRVLSPLDLSELVTDESLVFEALLYEKGLGVQWEVENGIRVLGDDAGLRQVVDVLLDNACKYTSPSGFVVCRLKREGRKRCVFSVATTGEPISEDALRDIFKRFVRLDESRSRTGSFGLGLSIAQAAVEAHRGKIWAESRDGINTFFVQLPVL